MQLERARIINFRSLRNVTVDFGAHTALIGGNGAGKSSMLKAIDKFYSTSKTCDVDDYFGRLHEIPIEIELTFTALTDQELATFHDRVRDGRLVVRRVFDGSASSGRYHGMLPQNPDFAPIRAIGGAVPKRQAYNNLRGAVAAYAEMPVANSAAAVDEAMSDWEANHPDQLELMLDDGQFFGFQNNSRGRLQRHTSFVFIPAVREAAADAADGKGSVIGRLLELLVRSRILLRPDVQEFKRDMSTRYQQLVSAENMPELGALAGSLTADLRSLYRDAEVELSWREIGDLPVPLPMADVALKDDGFGGPVDRQGHGLQRAFIFTLLQHLARTTILDVEAQAVAEPEAVEDGAALQSPTLILAIEEPELYQHPTKQRHFAEVLRNLSAGALPGAPGHTQIVFGSHSPLFISMGKADEVRLVRRVNCEDVDFKQCALHALNLEAVARKLEFGWRKDPGTFDTQTLIPRLHILGTELAEGFFANGVVLVEGRSDKAALAAVGRLMGVNFESAGIAILSAEGKGNLDKPLVIYRELGIPVFVLWDCDTDKPARDQKPDMDLALLRLATDNGDAEVAPRDDQVGASYAHFAETLEKKIREELTADVHDECLAAACEPFGLTPNQDTHKIPEVMYQTLRLAMEREGRCAMLEGVVRAIWRHLRHEEI
jgi:predicted ATPase